MVTNGRSAGGQPSALTTRAFELKIDGKKYQVQILRPGVISIDGNVFNVEMTPNGVKVDDQSFVASMCTDFGIVGGKLYEAEWKVQ